MLIAVNPFKNLPYFTDKEVDMYKGAVSRVQFRLVFGRVGLQSLLAKALDMHVDRQQS